jgi:hypothetical protein
MPLGNCVARDEIEGYNRYRGISRYIDPFVQLFCVRFDRSPEINDYWTDDDDGLTAENIDELTSDPDVFKLSNILFSLGDLDPQDTKDRYDMGEPMRQEITGEFDKPFRLPRSDLYGICNNEYAARFMVDSSSTCTQSIKLDQYQCTNTLSPAFWSADLKIYMGSDNNAQINVVVDQVFSYDPVTMAYASASTPPNSSWDGSACACSNALYEVEYTVYLKPGVVDEDATNGNENEHFVVDETTGKGVRANVAYYSTSFGSSCVDGSTGETALIP